MFLEVVLVAYALGSVEVGGLKCSCWEYSVDGTFSEDGCNGMSPRTCEGPDESILCVTTELIHKSYQKPLYQKRSCLSKDGVDSGCSNHLVSDGAAVLYIYACGTDSCNNVEYDQVCVRGTANANSRDETTRANRNESHTTQSHSTRSQTTESKFNSKISHEQNRQQQQQQPQKEHSDDASKLHDNRDTDMVLSMDQPASEDSVQQSPSKKPPRKFGTSLESDRVTASGPTTPPNKDALKDDRMYDGHAALVSEKPLLEVHSNELSDSGSGSFDQEGVRQKFGSRSEDRVFSGKLLNEKSVEGENNGKALNSLSDEQNVDVRIVDSFESSNPSENNEQKRKFPDRELNSDPGVQPRLHDTHDTMILPDSYATGSDGPSVRHKEQLAKQHEKRSESVVVDGTELFAGSQRESAKNSSPALSTGCVTATWFMLLMLRLFGN